MVCVVYTLKGKARVPIYMPPMNFDHTENL